MFHVVIGVYELRTCAVLVRRIFQRLKEGPAGPPVARLRIADFGVRIAAREEAGQARGHSLDSKG